MASCNCPDCTADYNCPGEIVRDGDGNPVDVAALIARAERAERILRFLKCDEAECELPRWHDGLHSEFMFDAPWGLRLRRAR